MRTLLQKLMFYAMVFLIAGLLLCPATTISAKGSKKEATDVNGFDDKSTSGIYTSNEQSKSPSLCVKLQNGWGKFEFTDFYTITITWYVKFVTGAEDIFIYIYDDGDDTENEVKIQFHNDGDENKIWIKITDTYAGDVNTEKQIQDLDHATDSWYQVALKIRRSASDLDGTKKVFSAEYTAEHEVISGFELFSGEIGGTITERNYNTVKFEGGETDAKYLDDFVLEASAETPTKGVNYLPLIIATGLVVSAVIVIKYNLVGFPRSKRKFGGT